MPPLRVLNLLKYLAKCKEAAAAVDLVGMFDCQGELSQHAKNIMLKHPDPNARGVFLGLRLRHSKADLTRAVLEGVTYGLRDLLELTRALGLAIEQVRASGGGARSPLWRHILADAFDTGIVTANVSEGAAYGAAPLADVGAGVYDSVAEAREMALRVTGRTEPGPAASACADYYPRYRALYRALAPEFEAMAQVVSKHLITRKE